MNVSWLNQLTSSLKSKSKSQARRGSPASRKARPQLEVLEERCLLATFTLNSTADEVDANPGDGVCETMPGNGVCTLRAAIQEANALAGYDTIDIPAGTYTLGIVGPDEDAGLTGDLDITEDLSISGAGADRPIIDAAQLDRIFDIVQDGTFNLSQVTLRNGRPTYLNDPTELQSGGAIETLRGGTVNLNLTDVFLTGNSGSFGGAIDNSSSGSTTITNSTISDNTTDGRDGGGISVSGDLTIVGSTISRNSAGQGGGVEFLADATLTISNSIISENTAFDGRGGGILIEGDATVDIRDSQITDNTTTDTGGGVSVTCCGLNSKVTIARTMILRNSGYGGGLGIESGELTVIDSMISSNESEFGAAGIFFKGTVASVTGSMITDNRSDRFDGGGIEHGGGLFVLSNSTISGNQAAGRGGGIYRGSDGELRVSDSSITGNTAAQDGGGISTRFPTTLTNVTLSGNMATNGSGGGVFRVNDGVQSPLSFENVHLSNNNPGGNCNTPSGIVVPFIDAGGSTDDDGTCGITPPPPAGELQMTTVEIVPSINPSVFGEAVTFVVMVRAASGTAAPSGTVTLVDGLTPLATADLADASASFANLMLSVRSHSITAEYSGDDQFTGSVSPVVNQTAGLAGTTTSLTASSSQSFWGQAVTFTATVGSAVLGTRRPTGSVRFMDLGVPVATSTLVDGRAILSTSSLNVGDHELTAEYGGDDDFEPSESPVVMHTRAGAFARFPDRSVSAAEPDMIPLHVQRGDFKLSRRVPHRVWLGLEATTSSPIAGSLVHIQLVRDGSQPPLTPVQTASDATATTFSLAAVRPGDFNAMLSADAESVGSYELDVFLAGDANGDYRVDRSDSALIRSLLGTELGDANYARYADVNRDGAIGPADMKLARRNAGASTTVRPLFPTAEIDVASDPEGDQVVNGSDLALTGVSAPLSRVRLAPGTNGGVGQTAVADQNGQFEFPTSVGVGVTRLRIDAADSFGQQASAAVSVFRPIDPANPDNVQVTIDQTRATSALVTSAGGMVESVAMDGTRFTLTVPPNALGADQLISLTPITAIEGSALDGQLIAGVQFGPDGLQFARPASLKVELPAGANIGQLIGLAYDQSGSNLHLVPRDVNGSTVTLEIPHFSGTALRSGSPDELLAYYVASIKPRLVDASTDRFFTLTMVADPTTATNEPINQQDLKFRQAVQAYFDWFGTVITVVTDEATLARFQPLFDEGNRLVVSVMRNGISRAYQRCYADRYDLTTILGHAREAVEWYGAAQRFVVDTAANGLDLQSVAESLCLKPKVTETRFPSSLQADQPAELFIKAGLGLVNDDRPPFFRPPIFVQLNLQGGYADPIRGFTDDFGRGEFRSMISLAQQSSRVTISIQPCLAILATTVCTTTRVSARGDLSLGLQARNLNEPVTAFRQNVCARNSQVAEIQVTLREGRSPRADKSVTFSVSGGGSLERDPASLTQLTDSNGKISVFFTAPTSESGTSTITASYAESNQTITRTIDVKYGPGVELTPVAAFLNPGTTAQFTAQVCGSQNSAVTWSATGGTIDASGMYTAGANPGNFSVTATSVADRSTTAQAAVVIVRPRPQGVAGAWFGLSTGALVTTGVPGQPRQIIIGFGDGIATVYFPNLGSDVYDVANPFAMYQGDTTGSSFTGDAIETERCVNSALAQFCFPVLRQVC